MMLRAAFVGFLMALAAAATAALDRPAPATPSFAPDLDAMLPDAFGGWTRVDLAAAVLPMEVEIGPGEAVAYRAYRDNAGRIVTLVAAYGPPLGDSVRLHRPETCYQAQGFAILDRSVSRLRLGDDLAAIVHLDTRDPVRKEAVSYWLRDGDAYITSAPGHQLLFFRRGLAGPSDGMLVRVSSAGEGAAAFALHDRFMQALASALSPQARPLFVAAPS